jgi:succinate-semialdehyde dehydrogenase / glutarate-semialdehyde dehydrogenase
MLISSTNPSQGYDIIESVESTDPNELNSLVSHSHDAQSKWKRVPLIDRVGILRNVYHECDISQEDLAQSIAREMGMPIRQSRDEVAYGMVYFAWYLDHAVEYLSPEITRETPTELHTVYYEPR